MHVPISRTCACLLATTLLLAGCADMPQGAGSPTVSIEQQMQRYKTTDPDEIRRRWGELELFIGDVFVSEGADGNDPEHAEYTWSVPGALARVDYLDCYKNTRKCDEGWYWMQYDAERKRLNFLNASTGAAWAHAGVQADGSVKVTRLSSGFTWVIRYDFDADEGWKLLSNGKKSRHIPTDRKQFAELRRTWKELDSETRSDERMAARRREREESQENWENFNRGMAALNSGLQAGLQEQRRRQAESAALNARIARANDLARTPQRAAPPTPMRAAPQMPSRPMATTLAPAPLTPLPRAGMARTTAPSASNRTPVPLKTNPLQVPPLSEQTLVAPQQPQARTAVPSTTTSAPARLDKPIGPPGTTILVPKRRVPEPEQRPMKQEPTVVASAPSTSPTLRNPQREWEERREREEHRERGNGTERSPGKASTRDDPYRCITRPIEAKPVIGSTQSCKAFAVYNRCSAPVDIRTCVYLTAAKKWSCEVKSVAPNGYKQHESCSPHNERFVAVKYADDYKTRIAMPPSR